jgi:hypothetical protein
MQRKIFASPKKRVGCKFQIIINHENKGQYLHFANHNITSWLLLPACWIKIPNYLDNTQCPYCYPLSKNLNVKQVSEIKKRKVLRNIQRKKQLASW